MTYSDDLGVLSIQHPTLADGLAGISNLERAFRYLEAQGFPLSGMDVTAQDEFSHDVCVPFPEGGSVLVIGVT